MGARPAPPAETTKRSPNRARPPAATPVARRRPRRAGPADVQEELTRVAGRQAPWVTRQLMEAADAYSHDRERDALHLLRPLRDRYPDAPSIRELTGLSQYRLGNYRAAAKELEAFTFLTGSVDQHPVLMDCYRAQHRWRKVDDSWAELAAVSPSAVLMAEGRIVYAGSLADRGDLEGALDVLRKKSAPNRRPAEHHLRLWYALADLEERGGNLAAARDLFDRVRRADPGFADVAQRRAALD